MSNFFWYSLRDQHCGLGPGDPDCSETTQSGLYFRGIALDQDRPKPILNAFRFPFVAFPSARRQIYVWGRTPNSSPGRVIITRNGRRLGVVKTNASGVFHRRFHLSRGSNRRGAVQAIFSKRKSVPFSLRHLKDPPNVRPFG